MATYGLPWRACTRATGRKKSPSSAIAKKMRGAVSSVPLSVPNVESITVAATNATPGAPTSRSATSAATSFERRISSTGSTAR